jgi:hypothetical protein
LTDDVWLALRLVGVISSQQYEWEKIWLGRGVGECPEASGAAMSGSEIPVEVASPVIVLLSLALWATIWFVVSSLLSY